ncbi:4-amino-4-deoxychorismate lyase [Bisgaardia hudsonensis]|uniref:4-amino-4-deoxychorismate lyase n=1 Tax=Bisgaardia hudsonensis TaxID=109472 RepID=A0A4R2MUI6_9PAST|nr:aminotransferase class IV family protein [Bisgaardia hudsonensis]QLB12305.1 hypothetical protein A6A11_01060 [Bisgaardia hudsonensis]TCP12350.1 4-amino-4-deoxychorismate lyase [Bisgaardia hudsonensis]
MFTLFETLCIKNGIIENVNYHQIRYEQSLKKLYSKKSYRKFDLKKIIEKATALTPLPQAEIVRCRINYSNSNYEIQFFPYQQKVYRSFKPVICDEIDYSLKYCHRDLLNQLLEKKGDCDEIIIIKKGRVTDCSIGNLIFRRGKDWFTPDTPLLEGTQRAKLLAENKIKSCSISVEDIAKFDEIRLINALNGL